MLRGLITGSLHDTPLTRESASGNTFTTCKLKDDSESPPAWYSVIAFGEQADTLSKLTKGDSLSISGRMTLKIYTGKDGNTRIDASVIADQIATLKRKPKPKQKESQAENIPAYSDNEPF